MRYISKGIEIDANDSEIFIKALSDVFLEEKDDIKAFFYESKIAYEECYKNVVIFGVPLPGDLIVKVLGAKKLHDYPKERPHFYDWMNKTYR